MRLLVELLRFLTRRRGSADMALRLMVASYRTRNSGSAGGTGSTGTVPRKTFCCHIAVSFFALGKKADKGDDFCYVYLALHAQRLGRRARDVEGGRRVERLHLEARLRRRKRRKAAAATTERFLLLLLLLLMFCGRRRRSTVGLRVALPVAVALSAAERRRRRSPRRSSRASGHTSSSRRVAIRIIRAISVQHGFARRRRVVGRQLVAKVHAARGLFLAPTEPHLVHLALEMHSKCIRRQNWRGKTKTKD